MSSIQKFIFAIFILGASVPAIAQEQPVIKIIRPEKNLTFQRPARCTPDVDCWVMNYPDIGPDRDGKSIDSKCLSRTYEGHSGTDLAIADGNAMEKGVDVLAAADGTVLRLRDGEPDAWRTKEQLEEIRKSKKECGNGIFLDHGNGWQTIYCHMKQGSIVVKQGQTVKAGDKIGQVGLSGMTEFPHIHLGITHNNLVMDPFTGRPITEACQVTGQDQPLWAASAPLHYEPVVIFDAGFGDKVPSLDAISRKREEKSTLSPDASALVFHTVLLGTREGDDISLSIIGPDGNLFSQSRVKADKARARQMYYVGRKHPASGEFQAGVYTGKISIMRAQKDGKDQILSKEEKITVE